MLVRYLFNLCPTRPPKKTRSSTLLKQNSTIHTTPIEGRWQRRSWGGDWRFLVPWKRSNVEGVMKIENKGTLPLVQGLHIGMNFDFLLYTIRRHDSKLFCLKRIVIIECVHPIHIVYLLIVGLARSFSFPNYGYFEKYIGIYTIIHILRWFTKQMFQPKKHMPS